MSLQII